MKTTWLKIASVAVSLVAVPLAVHAQDAADEYSYNYGPQMNDPFEPVNRGIFKFNEAVDTVLLKPVATVYTHVVPEYGRERVHNVLTNLGEPVVMFNAVLQRDPERAFTSLWRFVLNSTLGILGIFDFAGHNAGLVHREEDFGQTMGAYGWGSGPYIVLPILGSSSLRDVFGRVVDAFTNPFNYTESDTFLYSRIGMTAVDTRSRSLDIVKQIYETSVDPYATFRSAYAQRREALVRNNEPKDAKLGY